MSIPTPFNPLGTLGAVRERPYVQPQYKADLSGYVVEPSVPTTISTDRSGVDPRIAFLGRTQPVSEAQGSAWYLSGNRIIIEFGKPVCLTSVALLPTKYFSGRYLKGFRVLADGVQVGAVSGLTEENPVTWHEVAISSPRDASRIDIIFSVESFFGITQINLTGTYRP